MNPTYTYRKSTGITNATDITTEVKSTLFMQDGLPPYPNSMLREPNQSVERESNDDKAINIDSQSAATIQCEFTAYANRKI